MPRRHHQFTFDVSLLLFVISIIATQIIPVLCQIKILSPPGLVNAVEHSSDGSDVLQGTTATFGAPAYGESFVGRLFTADSNSTYCIDDYGSQIKSLINSTEPDGLRRIFLVRRGGCTFVIKTSIAQRLGADAVIVVDAQSSPWTRKTMATVIMADDGYGGNIRIPSVMVTKEDGQLLFESLKTSDVVVQLQWSLPQKSVVTMEFWTESGSSTGQRFLKDYAFHANTLRGHLRFTPHFNVYGLKSGSTDAVNLKLCLNGDAGLCSNPPDVLGCQVTGSDVLLENVRQLCLWETMSKEIDDVPDSKYSSEWWEYIRKFADSCPLIAPPGPRFSLECSYQVMSSIPSINVAAVKKCADERKIELLAREKENKAWSNLAVRINGARFSGSLDPIQVSKAVCSAFETPPTECDKLTGQTHPPSTNSGISASTVLFSLALIGTLASIALYFYQRYMRKSMRAALRHEVMLEVRSQLQEYHQLDEELDHSLLHKRPLMLSSS